MLRTFVVFFLLLLFGYQLSAQYVNTDELVFVPGLEQPLTIEEFEKFRLQNNTNYLSQFFVTGNGGYIISRFGPRSGRMHYGIDIKMNKGDTIKAAYDGYVERTSYVYGFGNLVVIRHKNNLQTYYAHLSAFLVKRGSRIKKGNPIGLAGSTGRSRGNHLHFEIRENGLPFDPEILFDFNNLVVREEAAQANNLAQLHRIVKPRGYIIDLSVPEYYRVRSGDNLWAISRRYRTSIEQICQLNNISEKSVLKIGQPLRMY